VMEQMAEYGEVIGIYNIDYRGVVRKNGVTYHFPKPSRWHLFFPLAFNRFVKSLAPDVVIVHGIIFPWQVIMLRLQLGAHVKIIAQHHAERPLRDIRQYFQRWADRYIKAYLFASYDLGQQWVERKQIHDSKKIKVIMGTSSPFYPIDKHEARSVTQAEGEKIFLWVGRLDSNKDPLVVVKAFANFIETHPEARLYMIYQTFQLLEALKLLILDKGVSNEIHLVGKVENPALQYWYNSADFIISSSHYEGSGIAVCEAMSCGCVPVLTDIPSFRMMTAEGRIGFLYEAGNDMALLAALQKTDSIDLVTEKKKVLDQFNKELSFEANARKIMEVIQNIE
ncbi:MAG: glycosyltransferase family 4 protein, partial [Bacteroidota bacterium]